MKYRVEYSLNSQREIEEVYGWIKERLPRVAEAWREELITKIEKLATSPMSHRLAPESSKFPCDIRQLLFRKWRGQYRVLYVVDVDRVVILSFRPSSRHPLEAGDLPL